MNPNSDLKLRRKIKHRANFGIQLNFKIAWNAVMIGSFELRAIRDGEARAR